MAINGIYLKNLKVDNYKSLKDSFIELKRGLNIIIGKNGAGKSNVLDFINRAAGRAIFNLSPRNILSNFSASIEYDSDGKENELSYELKRSRKEDIESKQDSPYSFELTITKKEEGKTVFTNKKIEFNKSFRIRHVEDKTIVKELEILGHLRRNYIRYALPEGAAWLSRPNRLTLGQDTMFEDMFSGFSFFSNLEFELTLELDAQVRLDTFKKDIVSLKNYLFDRLSSYLERLSVNFILSNYTPITDVRFNPNINVYSNEETTIVENLSVDFLVDGDWMPWSYLSDGTKRLFYIITECLSINEGVVLVEEPELGIHPHQLYKMLDFLKEQSSSKQIIISTHSPLALDVLGKEDLDRIIVAKYEKGTRFRNLSIKEINKAKKYMDEVGELSYYWLHSDLEK